jgi:hypothetical protein
MNVYRLIWWIYPVLVCLVQTEYGYTSFQKIETCQNETQRTALGECSGITRWSPVGGCFGDGGAMFGLHGVSISSCPLTPQPHTGLLSDEAAWPLRLCRRQRKGAVWDLASRLPHCAASADRLMSAVTRTYPIVLHGGVLGAQWWPWETAGTVTPPLLSTVIHCRNAIFTKRTYC